MRANVQLLVRICGLRAHRPKWLPASACRGKSISCSARWICYCWEAPGTRTMCVPPAVAGWLPASTCKDMPVFVGGQ
eukprot:1160150-Pelagomonas_calceolata.AAC.1